MKHLVKNKFEMTSFGLHILAMVCMLCDHLWGTIVPGNDWLTCIGRVAFPIYAFLIVEGYFYTKDLKKYVKRLLLFAVLSEIPFNLAMGSRVFYPVHQNVLWSFLIAIGLICWNENVKRSKKLWQRILVFVLSVVVSYVLGLLTMVDFYHAGLLTVLVFYATRNLGWSKYLLQAVFLWYINVELLGGYSYEISMFGQTYFVVRQGFALLSLLPIWAYQGKQGPYNRGIKYLYYSFYPVHLLVLGILKFFI